jgi:histidinol-phosphate aminotransferase
MYPIYTRAAGAAGREAPPLPADHAHMPYGHDLDAMLARIDAATRVIFIANPNNPTGTWLERDALLAFLDAVPREVVVVLDEAYIEYVDVAGFPNGMEWLARFPNLVVTRTFSKIYGLAGLRVGYGVASPELAAVIGRVRHPFNVSVPGLAAALAALDDQAFVLRSAELNRSGLIQLGAGLARLGLRCLPSVGNFLCFDLGREAAPVFQALQREGVILRPIANYGMPEHLRVSVGLAEQNARFLAALERVLGA